MVAVILTGALLACGGRPTAIPTGCGALRSCVLVMQVQAPSSAWPGQPSQLQALPIMRAFTFLRLSPEMTSPAYQV